jgi:hypothetical protein
MIVIRGISGGIARTAVAHAAVSRSMGAAGLWPLARFARAIDREIGVIRSKT